MLNIADVEEKMNTLSINNPQPSFQGVRIYSDVTIPKRPLSCFTLHIIPNRYFRGLKIGDKTVASKAADDMSGLFLNIGSIHDLNKDSYYIETKAGKTRLVRLKTLINTIIKQIGLKRADKDRCLEFIRNNELRVEKISSRRGDQYKIRFGKDHELAVDNIHILPPSHTSAQDA